MGSMYAAVLFIGVQNASSVQPVVAIERTVFYRERAAGMYSALPYAFGQVHYSQSMKFSKVGYKHGFHQILVNLVMIDFLIKLPCFAGCD